MLDFARMIAVRGWRRVARQAAQWSRDRALVSFLGRHSIEDAVLLSGFPKSGNTWTRFVFFNYHSVLLDDARQTLTYDQLNRIQHHALEWPLDGDFTAGYPVFFRTHLAYRKVFDVFRVIYVMRNPLDTLVSYYHSQNDRVVPFPRHSRSLRRRLADIDFFVRYTLERWIRHVKTTAPRADVVLRYEEMRADPEGQFRRMFRGVGIEPDQEALRRAVSLSSRESIRRMGRLSGQKAGGSETLFSAGYEFVRSGEPRQYLSRLAGETIDYARRALGRSGLEEIEL